jgi:tripartite-type tricarboxylate transporter receptor subunit TctC
MLCSRASIFFHGVEMLQNFKTHLHLIQVLELARISLATALILSATLCQICFSQQEPWPQKPITLVVTYPPGGTADIMARSISPLLSKTLNVNVIVENKPGASGQIAAAMVAKAAPDGYTLMLDASSYAVNPSLYPNLPYKPEQEFKTLGVLALYPNVLLVHPDFAAQTVSQLVNLAKSKPNAISYASSGNGSAQHLAGALFTLKAGVEMLHVPYKGASLALNDVLGGQIPVFFGSVGSTISFIENKKLIALAVTSAKRVSSLPEIPTMNEAGLTGYEIYEWNAMFAPAKTPPVLIQKLQDALASVLKNPDFKQRVNKLGGEIYSSDALAAEHFIHAQILQWSTLTKDKVIKVD